MTPAITTATHWFAYFLIVAGFLGNIWAWRLILEKDKAKTE